MKIAILFGGLLRNGIPVIKEVVDYFRKQKNVEQVDAYIHITWDASLVGKCIGQYNDNMVIQEDDPTDEIERIIQPKKLKLEKQADISLDGIPDFNPVYATSDCPLNQDRMYFANIAQIISFQKAYNLIENPSEYDAIIRTRHDLSIVNPEYDFPTEVLTRPKTITTTHGRFMDGYEWGEWFYGGTPQAMLFLANNLEELYRRYLQYRYSQNLKKEGPYIEVRRFLQQLSLDHVNVPLFFEIDRLHYLLKKVAPGESFSFSWDKNIKRKNISYG
jgi:hypothetical protein